MANDLAAGHRLELDWLAGKVVELGRKHNIPTPGHRPIDAILKPYRMGRGVELAARSASPNFMAISTM